MMTRAQELQMIEYEGEDMRERNNESINAEISIIRDGSYRKQRNLRNFIAIGGLIGLLGAGVVFKKNMSIDTPQSETLRYLGGLAGYMVALCGCLVYKVGGIEK